MDWPLQVGRELLPQVEGFKDLGVMLTSEGKMEWEIDRQIEAMSAVMRTLKQSVVVKKELSQKASSLGDKMRKDRDKETKLCR